MANRIEEPIFMVNGTLKPRSDARISSEDIGLRRGFGYFDFWSTYGEGEKTLNLQYQLNRLRRSGQIMGLELDVSDSQLAREISDTVEANTVGPKDIRVIITGGVGLDSITPADSPTRIIQVTDRSYYPDEYYVKGVGVTLVPYTRYLPDAKTNFYIPAVNHMKEARKRGDVEVVYYSPAEVTEGATSNIWMVKDGKISTPNESILRGITRQLLLENLSLAESVELRNITLDELKSADELFLTAANKMVMPVTRVDGIRVGDGNLGGVTLEVMKQFKQLAEKI